MTRTTPYVLEDAPPTHAAATPSLYHPTLPEFRERANGSANLIPVYREFPADLETPVSVYIKLMDNFGPSFLLESVEGGEQVGRYSFVGVNPRGLIMLRGRSLTTTLESGTTQRELAPGEDILHVIQAELGQFRPALLPGLPRLIGGAVGYLGYDTVRFFERLPETAEKVLDIPDAIFLLADRLVVFDHARHRLLILANAHIEDDPELAYMNAVQRIEQMSERLLRPLPSIPSRRWPGQHRDGTITANKSKEEYADMVRAAKEHIAAGDIFQVVLSQRLSRTTHAHPFAVYRALRMLNPSPYMFYFDFGPVDLQVVGASPEMHVRLEDGTASVRPIAGTRWRGRDEAEDQQLATDLLNDPKERAEHVMLVDLGRNDIGRVSEFGTVQVRNLMTIEKYSHVMHIVSHVEGKLHADKNAFDLMRATFPAGTVSGAPKVRAMAIIEELEGERRGLYAGAVGHFGYDGNMDTCIALRTMLVRDGRVYVQAGAGIVADSDPYQEYQECLNKARALLLAVENAEQGLL
ncbi:MAG: anthranilate synthase component I [Chloroflexi bacterium]|nr:anthranilate synthase component I [Chloroflexota bacterium]MBP8054965.1 anthranilate synthase component I [Chloroflexota bacterium]